MEIRETSLSFPETEGDGPIRASTTLTFPREVRRVAAGITGYSARFEDEEDHHLGRLEVEVSAAIDDDDDTVVNVNGVLGLRDWSNEFDDPYSGIIDIAVLAELVPAPIPLPGEARTDLLIVDAEISQVIQHFRSSDHLDAPNVFPDNSIRLVADKPTIVRLYTDYDASSGLPVINLLRGELVIEGNGTTTTTPAIEVIMSRRDVSIDRGNRRHTLNFMIPEAICRGVLTLRGTVFDAADPTQFSQTFVRDIRFDTQPALRIMAVGIEYTGPDTKDGATDADLAAPVEADFVDVFDLAETLFPIPEVEITSYVEIDYDEETVSDIGEGCDKLADMRDTVGELRGDSDDIVYGLFNEGVDTGTVGGCGGGGTGVGRIGREGTAAHELGHALGRQHAPCDNVTRCAQPLNTDDNYPEYSGFDSDSIGEFGVDLRTSNATVIDPVLGHDIMGYSSGDWVSPYTYKALMSAIPVEDPGGAAFAKAAIAAHSRTDGEWIRGKQPKLFLRLDVDRHGHVDLQPSFHFPARPRPIGSVETDYTIEFVDDDGRVLSSTCLLAADPGCGCGCGDGEAGPAVRIRQAVVFPARADRMALVRCGETVEEWPIPEPPKVTVEVECGKNVGKPGRSTVAVRWTIGATEGSSPETSDGGDGYGYWSLVQWRDRAGTWRGCAPRTQETELKLPRSAFGRERDLTVRVLVTSGIATGVGEWSGPCATPPVVVSSPEAPRLVLTRGRSHPRRPELGGTIRVAVVGTRSGGPGRIRWHGPNGGELGRGRTLDLGALPVGQTVVVASVVGAGDRVPAARWAIERTTDGRFFLLEGDQRPRQPNAPADDPANDGHDHEGDNTDDGPRHHPRPDHSHHRKDD